MGATEDKGYCRWGLLYIELTVDVGYSTMMCPAVYSALLNQSPLWYRVHHEVKRCMLWYAGGGRPGPHMARGALCVPAVSAAARHRQLL